MSSEDKTGKTAMRIESLINVQQRIAEIEDRIEELTGRVQEHAPDPSRLWQTPFAVRLQQAVQRQQTAGVSQWEPIIQEAAAEYGLDPALLRAVIAQESGGNPSARSSAGAMGLMQLMPATAESLGVTDPYDPRQNIFGGARYLRGLLDRMGSVELALAAYNAGPGAVRRFGGIPPFPETRNYVASVMSRWSREQ